MDERHVEVQARTKEIERQLESKRFRLRWLKWIGGPAFLSALGYLVYFAVDRGVGFSTGLLGGVAGLVVATITAVRGFRELRAETEELEAARRLLVAGAVEHDPS